MYKAKAFGTKNWVFDFFFYTSKSVGFGVRYSKTENDMYRWLVFQVWNLELGVQLVDLKHLRKVSV